MNIEFYVDKTQSDADDTNNQYVVDMVKKFQWEHDTVESHLEKKNAGIFNMWVRPFPVKADRTRSKSYLALWSWRMTWRSLRSSTTKRMLLSYGEHQDGNLYGFTIQRSHSIIGVKKGAIWGEHFHDKSVNKSSLFYRYQLLSTWGQVFFPRHWNAFVEWALKARNDTKFVPCIPYLVCNDWYFKGSKSIWSIWFNYFVYQSGLTNLYIKFNQLDKNVNKALLVNHREKGLHYFSNSKTVASTTHHLAEVMINETLTGDLPPLSRRIPLYIFFFNLVDNEKMFKHQWRFTSNVDDM